jgi:uracil-DNA glycosylase
MTYSGPFNPKMLLVGEAWGADEEKVKLPFVGVSGQELWRLLGEAMPHIAPELHSHALELCSPQWGLAWIRRRDAWLEAAGIGMTNVLNMRPHNNKLDSLCVSKKELPHGVYPHAAMVRGKYLKPEYLHHLYRLLDEIEQYKPNLVVAMGNAACWAVLNTTGITSIRGTTIISNISSFNSPVKVLPTFHPASLLYEGQWSNRTVVVADLMKAAREAEYPEVRRPNRTVLVSPTLEEVREWIEETLRRRPWRLAVDIETSGGIIDCIGFASSPSNALVVPFGPHRYRRGQSFVIVRPIRNGEPVTNYWDFDEERQVWKWIKILLESGLPLVFQNGTYDLQYIRKVGIRPDLCADDTMLAWHSLYAEMPKRLGFIGSILTDEVAWKNLNKLRSDTVKRDE